VKTVRLTAAQALVQFLANQYVARDGVEDSDPSPPPLLPVDLAANAESLGARAIRCETIDELRAGLGEAKKESRTVVLSIEVDHYEGVPGYESWWDVPVAEVAETDSVRAVRAEYDEARQTERSYL
jgi:3D-(3,5/4)-trihydroxycyclohexane-1,2-dione acylhydrolase (decyclizing)